MVRLRFHLGAGPNCGKWQLRSDDGSVRYFDPATTNLRLIGCRLRNQKHSAQQIHDGANKHPCAWVEAQWVYTFTPTGDDMPCGEWVGFNPRVAPHWRDASGSDIDGREYSEITTDGRELVAQ